MAPAAEATFTLHSGSAPLSTVEVLGLLLIPLPQKEVPLCVRLEVWDGRRGCALVSVMGGGGIHM